MNRFLKFSLIALFILIILVSGAFFYFFLVTSPFNLETEKLISVQNGVEIYSKNNEKLDVFVQKTPVVKIDSLKNHTVNAFIAVEDKRFYNHKGIDYKAISRAFIKNLTTFSFKEGGSTISQQLIKNTHLSNEKTLKRKLIEIKLTKQLEKKFSKNQILETYLNTIYFGKNLYGIENASNYYFSKSATELSISESAILAGIVKAPSQYLPTNNYEKCLNRRNVVLKLMQEQGYISTTDYENAKNSKIDLKLNEKAYDFNSLCLIELNQISKDNPYLFSNCKIYTSFDDKLQEILETATINNSEKCDKSAVVLDKNNRICAYYSTTNNINRQIGSTIKPLAVFAPAIEENLINEHTLILDEKTDFNGYAPSNYNGKYHGYVSAKTALAKSLNIPSVKILNSLGVAKSKNYLIKMDIDLTNDDSNLSLALGGTKQGVSLLDLTGAYDVFKNEGFHKKVGCIEKIVDKNGNILYKNETLSKRVFSPETAYFVCDMLKETVNNGTAKRLQNKNAVIYAKTGTVGNSKGNTDAYCVSFTDEYSVGVWLGNADNSYIKVTGGTTPTVISADIYEDIYKNKISKEISMPENIKIISFDKFEYENNKKFVLADENCPESEKIDLIFDKNKIPNEKSSKYSNPKIKDAILQYNNFLTKINITSDKFINFLIYKRENLKEELIYDSNENEFNNTIIDENLNGNTVYEYLV
ncbi:MAG: transglycosylase domain-containing protein, partial [Clostridia bacterium]|nr:transglycosylase domain-containing protein [Clostridia bacterium]